MPRVSPFLQGKKLSGAAAEQLGARFPPTAATTSAAT